MIMSSSSPAFTRSPTCSYSRDELLQPGALWASQWAGLASIKQAGKRDHPEVQPEKFKHELNVNGHHQTPSHLFLSEIIQVADLVTC